MELSLGHWLPLLGGWLLFMLPLLWRRFREGSTDWQAWTVVLSGEMEARYDYLREIFEGNAELVDSLLADGRAPRGLARTPASVSWGLTAVDAFAGTAVERLQEWQQIARVVEAEVPESLPGLRTTTYRLAGVQRAVWRRAVQRPIARLFGAAFGMRLTALALGFAVVRRSGASLHKTLTVALWADALRRAHVIAHDFRALSVDTLVSARALLAAIERRAA